MKKFSVSFKYLDWNSRGRKYFYANDEEEAKEKFKEYYKNYNVEITGIKEIEVKENVDNGNRNV